MILTPDQLTALLPIIALGVVVVLVMLVVAFVKTEKAGGYAAILGLLATFAVLPFAARVLPLQVTPLLLIDGYALIYTVFLLAATLAVAALGNAYFDGRPQRRGEFFVLLLSAALGGLVLVASNHFASFFLGLELLSVSLFALLGYTREHQPSLEAATKYVILSGVSSATLLFGMALMYTDLGSLEFSSLSGLLSGPAADELYAGGGLALVVAGVAFKLSLVPFHLWTPDVYQGAPAPVTAFLSTVSKGAIFAVLLRYFSDAGIYGYRPLFLALAGIAIVSMLAGNILALLQDNVKRILAYSSIAHMGYLLVAFLAGGATAIESVTYYLAAYFVTNIGAFGIIAMLSAPGASRDADTLADLRGLFWRRPWLASVFTLMLLSLAGIPLTMGFIAKFYVFAAGVEASHWWLVFALLAGSAIGLFYYLRVIVALYSSEHPERNGSERASTPLAGTVALILLTALLVWLGVYPAPLIDVIRAMAVGPPFI